jgi:periplasmic divalent cation tolerance protein
MPAKKSIVYLFWTCRDKTEAKKIIYNLLEKHLIACASILPEVESIYRWEGKIEESREVKVILKTVPHHFDVSCQLAQIGPHCAASAPWNT